MSAVVQVTTTLDTRDGAERLAAAIVEARLAACAQVLGPITSTYRWQGAVETASEWLVLIKTTSDALPALEARLRADHPYEVPEIIAVPVVAGLGAYLEWVRETVQA